MQPLAQPGPDLADAVALTIARRRSTRHFTPTPIARSTLERLVLAGIQAPSGSNWQNQRFLILDQRQEIEALGRIRHVWPYKSAGRAVIHERHPAGILGHAAALIVVFADAAENDRRGNGEYHLWETLEIQNCAAAIENILLLATALGLGSCWVSASSAMNHTRLLTGRTWRDAFSGYSIPEHYKIQGIILLGEPVTLDDSGFPAGERAHGATLWQSTDRQPIGHYLIGRRVGSDAMARRETTAAGRWRLRLWSRLLHLGLALVRVCDRSIHRLENRILVPPSDSHEI